MASRTASWSLVSSMGRLNGMFSSKLGVGMPLEDRVSWILATDADIVFARCNIRGSDSFEAMLSCGEMDGLL